MYSFHLGFSLVLSFPSQFLSEVSILHPLIWYALDIPLHFLLLIQMKSIQIQKQKTIKTQKHIQFSFLYMSWWTYYLDIPFWPHNETMHILISVWFLANPVLSGITFWDLSRNRCKQMIDKDKMSSTLQSSAVPTPIHLLCLFCSLICSIPFRFYLGITLGSDTDILRLRIYMMDTLQVAMDNLTTSLDMPSPDPNHVADEQCTHPKWRCRLEDPWELCTTSRSLTWEPGLHG